MKTLTKQEFEMLEVYQKIMDGPCYQDQECDVHFSRDENWMQARNLLAEQGYLIMDTCISHPQNSHIHLSTLAKTAMYMYRLCRQLEITM
jgi:hypothetical protein